MHDDDSIAEEMMMGDEPSAQIPNLGGFLTLLRLTQSNTKTEMYLESVMGEGWALSAILPKKPYIYIWYRAGKVMTELRRPGVDYGIGPRLDQNLCHLDRIVENAALEAELLKRDIFVFGDWQQNGLDVWWMYAWKKGLDLRIGKPYLRVTPGGMITLHYVSDGPAIIV